MSNLNSKKLIVTLFAVAGLTFAMYLEKISGQSFVTSLIVLFSTYMAIQTKSENRKE